VGYRRLNGNIYRKDKEHTDSLRKCLSLCDNESIFPEIEDPNPGDWLAVYSEPGQTAAQYAKSGFRKIVDTKNKVYILPLGDFVEGQSPPIDDLKQFAERYLCMPVAILPTLQFTELDSKYLGLESKNSKINLSKAKIEFRINYKRQILTGDVEKILKRLLPDDGYCLLAFTMEDLFPSHEWNFVFGEADPINKVGLFSFARYHPEFFKKNQDYTQKLSDKDFGLLFKRSCQVMVHEIIHMFGFEHCIHYDCCMNGANHIEENDRQAVDLCPVCLHKLFIFRSSIQTFDPVARYQNLLEFYGNRSEFKEQVEWTNKLFKILKEQSEEKERKSSSSSKENPVEEEEISDEESD